MSITTTKPWAIIYIRVSSDEQIDGTSLDFQETECRKYCERKGFEVVAVFREEGESAKDLSLNNRKEFLRGIEFCRKNKGKVQAFVVLRVNRFARNTEDHFIIRKKLASYGVTLHSVTEPIGNKPIEKLVETVAAASSDYENAIRKQQCADGMSEKVNQGLYPWKSPYGYVCGQFKKRGLKKTEPDQPDPITFPLMQKLFRVCLEERIGSSVELAKRANQMGMLPKSSKKIYPQWIDDRFCNKFYAGIIVNPFTGEEIQGKHVAMVTSDEFNQIQLIRRGKVRAIVVKRQKNNPDFPLTRDIKCPDCGIGLSGSHSRGNGGAYASYHCHNKNCAMYGKTKGLGRNKVHGDFLAWLGTVTPKQEFMDLFKEIVVDVWRNNAALLDDIIKRQEAEVSELKQKKFEYAEMIRKGTISEDFGKELLEKTDNEIATKQITARENHLDKLDIETSIEYAANFISDLPRTWNDVEVETKKRFQKLILPEGIVYSKESGFGTAKLGLIYELNRQFDGEKTSLVDLRGIEPRLPPCHGGVIPIYYRPS